MINRINCDEIYGLYLIDPRCNLDQYISAFSFNKEILENILNNDVNNDEKKHYIIKKVNYYSLNLIDNKYFITRKNSMSDDNYDKNLYGFNKITVKDNCELCEQVLLNIPEKINIDEIRTIPFFKNSGLSHSRINFDQYYFESILNA